ncbi:MAG TPA: lamin tail domain-containing protein, partial [Verrucomicrobiae bacterium]|nr:lamin tail domain-containing protein [Verrucomicrobiae bacterium]
MRRTRILLPILFGVVTSLFPLPLQAVDDVVISEFMAVNNGPLADEDGDFSDWIELQNLGTNIVNLDGWYLTDKTNDLKQWRFPATNLAPNAFLIVFASSKDRRVAGAPLHTNFRLGSEGEYLGLIRADGVSVASAFSPNFPIQIGGASFGLPLRQTESILVSSGAVARVLVPTDGTLGSSWNGLMFNDASWPSLRTGIGFETDSGGPFVPTQIANSVTEFGGTQGLNNWSYGYWNQKTDANGEYAASEFVPFPNSGGSFGPNNYWTGSSWDWFSGDPPFTQINSQGATPTGDNGIQSLPTHWAVRRYINEHNGPLTINGRITHTSDWVFVTQTGVSLSSLLYIYLTDAGEGYIDDIRLVQGTTPAVGVNLIANGDFESNLNPNWSVSPNLAASAPSTNFRKSGTRSLRIVASAGGSSQGSAIYQTISPTLPTGQIYTLSYWYLPVITNQAPLVVRFSGSWIETSPIFCGDGVIARIFVDGQQVFSQPAFVNTADYSITVPATLGSRVDFAVDAGAAADDACDDATFTASITSADPNIALVADSISDWSTAGKQGEKNWYYGYWNSGTNIPLPAYTAANFTPFPRSDGPFGAANFWTGREWDWWNGDPPIDEIGERLMWANGLNNTNIHWVIRRWRSEVSGPVIVDWTVTKLEASGAGVSVRVFHNGIQRDFVTLPGTNAPIVRRSTILSNVQVGDPIDIVLDPTGIGGGYGDGGDPSFVTAVIRGSPSLTGQIFSTIQSSMQNIGSSAYLRIPFTVTDPAAIQFLTLRMKYDDGFAAWINGVPVASANSPLDPLWNSTATGTRSDADANDYVEFNLTPSRGALQMGNNVLAIHGLNFSAADSDFLILPELIGARLELATNAGQYFSIQTPGTANGYGQTNLGPIITGAGHSPNIPSDIQDLRVTANLTPTFRPIGSVRLFYRTMFSAEVETPMFDDGLHQDGLAGDGTYAGIIPAAAAGPGQMVRYYVYATDNLGNASRFPAFEDPLNSPQYQGTVVANPSQTNALPIFHMFVQNPVMATNYIGTRCSIFYDGEFYDNVAVNLHGQTTAFVFGKRSMDIDMNRGYTFRWKEGEAPINDFVLLTPIADKAYVRQIMAYETFAKAGVPTHFAFFVRVEQNGQFFGIFDLVEKGDDNFLERNGLDPLGALYKVYLPLTNAYGGVAEKKTRHSEPNDDLNDLVNGVSLTGQPLRRYVCDNIDIPEVINFLATIQLVQNEDCCWFKNYYLYRDTRGSGEWQMFPWDLDLTFGRTFGFFVLNNQVVNGYFNTNIFWTNAYYTQRRSTYDYIGVSQPIVNALFIMPETYDMFLRRWTTVQLEFLRTNATHPLLLGFERRIDELVSEIRSDAALDFAKWGNWFPTQNLDVAVQVLKNEYLARRRGWIFNTLAFANDGPYLGPQPTNVVVRFGTIDYNPSGSQGQEYIQITNANLIAVDISGWKISGGIDYTFRHGTVIPARNAIYVTPDVNAFRARLTGPRGSLGLFVQGNYSGQLSAWGEPLQITDPTGRIVTSTNIPSAPSTLQRYLRITEIMYNPSAISGNPTDPQEFEYVELKNTGPITLNLIGVSFSNGIEFQFTSGSPVTSLAPGQSVLIVRNIAAFTARYGAGFSIAGQFTGALDNAGEVLRLDDATGEKILEFAYDNSWHPITDGFGFSLVVVNEASLWENWGLPQNWQPSGQLNGSPGQSNTPGPTLANIKVNEVLSASTPPAVDAVELYNPTAGAVNIGGWFLSDDFRTPKKYRIPNNTTIPALGYLVFTEAQFNPTNPPSSTGFAFSSSGDEVYLFSADGAGNLTGYEHGFSFGAADPGVSLGLHVTSTGEEHFVAQSATTLGAANGPPRVGPLVISEIYFHPVTLTGEDDNADDEFIEIRNISGSTIPLYDPG